MAHWVLNFKQRHLCLWLHRQKLAQELVQEPNTGTGTEVNSGTCTGTDTEIEAGTGTGISTGTCVHCTGGSHWNQGSVIRVGR